MSFAEMEKTGEEIDLRRSTSRKCFFFSFYEINY